MNFFYLYNKFGQYIGSTWAIDEATAVIRQDKAVKAIQLSN